LQRLSVLDASYNDITELPSAFGELKWLRVIHLSHNKITDMRPLLGCIACEELDLSYNNIVDIPADIGTMPSVVKFDLSYNDIAVLPDGITQV
jgi:Leucine-rich repeat (LRR) protein